MWSFIYGLEPSPWAICPAPLTTTDVLTNVAQLESTLRRTRTVSLYQRKQRDIFPNPTLGRAEIRRPARTPIKIDSKTNPAQHLWTLWNALPYMSKQSQMMPVLIYQEYQRVANDVLPRLTEPIRSLNGANLHWPPLKYSGQSGMSRDDGQRIWRCYRAQTEPNGAKTEHFLCPLPLPRGDYPPINNDNSAQSIPRDFAWEVARWSWADSKQIVGFAKGSMSTPLICCWNLLFYNP
jgi:hypothetical protein